MSGVAKIVIREAAAELKTLLGREKDAVRPQKLLILYWLKTQTVDSVLSAAVQRTVSIVPQYKDGCLATELGE
jgi:hypothetical protein